MIRYTVAYYLSDDLLFLRGFKMFRSLFVIILVMLFMSGCKSKQEGNVQKTVKEEKKVETTSETTKVEEKKEEVVNPADLSLAFKDINEKAGTEIIVKNKKTGEEKLLTKIEDSYNEHYHSKEIINNHLFIIRRTGDTVKWTKWSDELWFYSPENANGKKIFDLQGLDFRAAGDLKYIAIVSNDKLSFIDMEGKTVKEISVSDFEKINPKATEFGALTPDKWSDDSNEFLVYFIEQDKILGSFKIVKDTWEIKSAK